MFSNQKNALSCNKESRRCKFINSKKINVQDKILKLEKQSLFWKKLSDYPRGLNSLISLQNLHQKKKQNSKDVII